MEREVGGGIGMGNTCKPLAVSFQCMTKSTTNKKKKKKKKNLPVNAEDTGSIPEIPHAAEQLSPCTTTTETALQSPCSTTRSLHNEKPTDHK